MEPVIVWLWDTLGADCGACGVCTDRARAQQAAQACLEAGRAVTALVQQAHLVDGSEVLTAYYQRFGQPWRARRAGNGAVRWTPLPERAAG